MQPKVVDISVWILCYYFPITGPQTWNDLAPGRRDSAESLIAFRCLLKTHLCDLCSGSLFLTNLLDIACLRWT